MTLLASQPVVKIDAISKKQTAVVLSLFIMSSSLENAFQNIIRLKLVKDNKNRFVLTTKENLVLLETKLRVCIKAVFIL
jgi:hypothetical protein